MNRNIQLIHGDCMEALKTYPYNHFDVAIVDPPYGINVNMNMGKKKGETARYDKKKWDKEPPSLDYFIELIRVSKNQIIWGGNYFTDKVKPSMGWLIWDKNVPDGVSFSDFEMAWTSFNQAAKKIKLPYCGFIGLNGQSRIHPTEKPIALYRWLLDKYTKEGDLILDTHLGSASIAIACHYMKRNLIGYEIDKEYYDKALKRFKDQTKQMAMF